MRSPCIFMALVLLFAMLRYSLGFDAVRSGELWGIGTPAWLWFASAAGLVAAAFNHLYIWVHYFATERPDMLRIYGGGEDGRRA